MGFGRNSQIIESVGQRSFPFSNHSFKGELMIEDALPLARPRNRLIRWTIACVCACIAVSYLVTAAYCLFLIMTLGLVIAQVQYGIGNMPFYIAEGIGFAIMAIGLGKDRSKFVYLGLAILIVAWLFQGYCIIYPRSFTVNVTALASGY